MTKTTVYLPLELKRALTRLARQRRCSEAELLREAVARLAPRGFDDTLSASVSDPVVLAMALESRVARSPQYAYVPADSIARGVAAQVGGLRYVTAAALAFLLGAAVAMPMWYAVRVGWLTAFPAGVAALSLGVPVILWAVLWAFGLPQRLDGLGPAVFIGAVYFPSAVTLPPAAPSSTLQVTVWFFFASVTTAAN